MPSDRKAQASRKNGAKSRGPITPEGKRRSSQNRRRHGLLAKTIVLAAEQPERFTRLLTSLCNEFEPQTPVEMALVETMAVARWRQMRIWSMEKANLEHEIRNRTDSADPATQAALAFRDLTDQSRSMELMNRYESRYDRQFTRALSRLCELRSGNLASFARK